VFTQTKVKSNTWGLKQLKLLKNSSDQIKSSDCVSLILRRPVRHTNYWLSIESFENIFVSSQRNFFKKRKTPYTLFVTFHCLWALHFHRLLMRVLSVLPPRSGPKVDPLLLPLDKMLDESSDFYLSDSSSTTSSNTVHTNNASGDELDNNNQLFSLIALHPNTASIPSAENPLLVSTTNSLTLIGGMNHLPNGASSSCTNGSSTTNLSDAHHHQLNDYNTSGRLPSSGGKIDVNISSSNSSNLCLGNNNAIITVDLSSLGGSVVGGPGVCDMMVDPGGEQNSGSSSNGSGGGGGGGGSGGSLSDDSNAQSVSTTILGNSDGETVKKKNPVGRRKLILSTREKTLRRLESNERERLRMHSLNQAFQVKSN
jgi:hypothetical protein